MKGICKIRSIRLLDFTPNKKLLQRPANAITQAGCENVRQSFLSGWEDGQVVQAAKAYCTILLEMCG